MDNEDDLNKKLEKLKEYSVNKKIENINKKIYSLNITDTMLSDMEDNWLIYIHIKLHNAIAYRKPFAPFKKIKELHDKVSKLMKNHKIIDKLDE